MPPLAEQLRKNVATWAEIPPPPACPNDAAAWSNYGAGWPGKLGVPTLALSQAPVLGEDVSMKIGNSAGEATTALMIFGAAPVNLQSDLGGTLLVLPKIEGRTTQRSATSARQAREGRDSSGMMTFGS